MGNWSQQDAEDLGRVVLQLGPEVAREYHRVLMDAVDRGELEVDYAGPLL